MKEDKVRTDLLNSMFTDRAMVLEILIKHSSGEMDETTKTQVIQYYLKRSNLEDWFLEIKDLSIADWKKLLIQENKRSGYLL